MPPFGGWQIHLRTGIVLRTRFVDIGDHADDLRFLSTGNGCSPNRIFSRPQFPRDRLVDDHCTPIIEEVAPGEIAAFHQPLTP